MSKNLDMCRLLDLYGCLLTEKQFDIMDFYYNDDLSLGEIADHYEISRQGVHDAIKRGDEALTEYEERLGLLKAEQERRDEIAGFRELALAAFNECNAHRSFRNVAEKIVVLLETFDEKLEEYENPAPTEEKQD
jgi:predicted DNA-binding protein YlxM (UPF0122 family)